MSLTGMVVMVLAGGPDRERSVSLLSGAHLSIMPRIVELMKAEGLDDVPVLVGGIVPEEDVPPLESAGVDKVFTPGATLDEIVAYIRRRTRPDAH